MREEEAQYLVFLAFLTLRRQVVRQCTSSACGSGGLWYAGVPVSNF